MRDDRHSGEVVEPVRVEGEAVREGGMVDAATTGRGGVGDSGTVDFSSESDMIAAGVSAVCVLGPSVYISHNIDFILDTITIIHKYNLQILISGAAVVASARVYKAISPDMGKPHSVGFGPPIA